LKKDHIQELYAKYIKNESSAEELKEFFDYIQTNAADAELMGLMDQEDWDSIDESEASDIDEEVFKRVEARLKGEIFKKDNIDKE
jgi:hypothetical protein